jgi:nucleoside-triphosphatase THEP1
MQRAYSVSNVQEAKFQTLNFTGEWKKAVGSPELTGTWFIYGPPKNGKTSFAMKLVKYLTNFKRSAYNSVEEGLSLTIQMAMDRVNMIDVGSKLILLEKEEIEPLIERLQRHKSPDVIVIDSIQFMELKFSDYKRLKTMFPHKLFIYVSHVEGKQPEGSTAKRIWRDANVAFRVEGFKAFTTSRYGGGSEIVISEEFAKAHWGLKY